MCSCYMYPKQAFTDVMLTEKTSPPATCRSVALISLRNTAKHYVQGALGCTVLHQECSR